MNAGGVELAFDAQGQALVGQSRIFIASFKKWESARSGYLAQRLEEPVIAMRSEELPFAEQLLMEYDCAHQEIDKVSIDRGAPGDNIQDICKPTTVRLISE